MTVGTDLLATVTFPGINGAALPAGFTAGLGTWTQNGAAGCTYDAGLGGAKYAYADPTRANDNYSIQPSTFSIGSSFTGFMGRITGSGLTASGYYVGDDNGGGIQISRIDAGSLGAALAQSGSVGTGATEWLAQSTISFETVGSDVVIRATSLENATVLTYTDLAAATPFLSGTIGVCALSTGTPSSYTGPLIIRGTSAGGGAPSPTSIRSIFIMP